MQYTTSAQQAGTGQAKILLHINMYNLLYSINTAHNYITMCSVQSGVYKSTCSKCTHQHFLYTNLLQNVTLQAR